LIWDWKSVGVPGWTKLVMVPLAFWVMLRRLPALNQTL